MRCSPDGFKRKKKSRSAFVFSVVLSAAHYRRNKARFFRGSESELYLKTTVFYKKNCAYITKISATIILSRWTNTASFNCHRCKMFLVSHVPLPAVSLHFQNGGSLSFLGGRRIIWNVSLSDVIACSYISLLLYLHTPFFRKRTH